MFHAIRRLIGKASPAQLVEVLRAAEDFVNNTRPLVEAVIARPGNTGESQVGWVDGNGQSALDRSDTFGEVDTGEATGDDVFTALLSEAEREPSIRQSLDRGHEATMESDHRSNGEEHTSPLSALREG